MSDEKREKAIQKVYSLDQLANHPNTPPAEAESARSMAAKLRAKYGIAEPRKTAPTANRFKQEYPSAEDIEREWRDMVARERQRQAERKARLAEEEARRKAQREAWQKAKERQYPPTTGDPLEDAIRRDGRTPQEKNRDMQDRLRGKKPTPPPEPRCTEPESFFTPGGEPRQRNQHVIACEKCGRRLQPGEGAILKVGGVWKAWCAEMTPGPRRKQPWARS